MIFTILLCCAIALLCICAVLDLKRQCKSTRAGHANIHVNAVDLNGRLQFFKAYKHQIRAAIDRKSVV